MVNEFHLPDIGEGLTEATVISWYVGVGESVGLDEPLVEVETDKAVVDIPAPFAGVVLHHGARAGEIIEVDSLLVAIGEAGETWEPSIARSRASADAAPIVGTLDEAPAVVAGTSAGEVAALPKVRRLAAELGVDLATLQGSGVGGRVTEDDVRRAIPASGGPTDRVPMTATRRSIADHLSRSWREIPHVTIYDAADAEALLTRRAAAGKPMLEAMLIAAILPVLQQHPDFNAAIVGDDIFYRKYYDVGLAIDTPAGLVVAVVHDAAGKSVAELDADTRRLADAARARKLAPEELRGQTFTISNIGAVGGGYGTPLVPLGTSAILSIGRADPTPVVCDGEIAVRRQFPLSLSYDHRIIDGAAGRAFMAAVVAALGE